MPDLTLTVDLLQRAKGGDAAAQSRLLERYQPRIFQIVRMLMGTGLRRQMDSADRQKRAFESVPGQSWRVASV